MCVMMCGQYLQMYAKQPYLHYVEVYSYQNSLVINDGCSETSIMHYMSAFYTLLKYNVLRHIYPSKEGITFPFTPPIHSRGL